MRIYLNIFSKKINKDNGKTFFQTYRSILITFFLYIIFIYKKKKKIITCFYKIYTSFSFSFKMLGIIVRDRERKTR